VSLDPPRGFVTAQRFAGFQNEVKGASIMVTELPGPASEMQKGMTREPLASRGMTLLRSQTVKARGGNAVLIHVSQSASGIDFLKWILIAGDAKQTVMVVGMFPKGAAEMSLPLKQAVLSATWSGGAGKPQPLEPARPYEGLAFRVDPTPALKLAGRVGNTLVFTESGSMGPGDADQAILVIGGSVSEASIKDVGAFAKERAGRSTQVGTLRNIKGRALTGDGLPGYELLADAQDARTGRDMRMYQLVLADQSTYYLAQGFVAAERAPALVEQFRQVTGSFRLLHPPR
jgi:hypothetical protein